MIINRETIKQELDRLDDSQLLQVAHLITALQSQEKLTQTTAKKRLSDFYAILPATQPYPGTAAIRQHVAAAIAQPTADPQP